MRTAVASDIATTAKPSSDQEPSAERPFVGKTAHVPQRLAGEASLAALPQPELALTTLQLRHHVCHRLRRRRIGMYF
jgi:hypothetical protein